MTGKTGWAVLIAGIALFCCVLGFYQATAAAPRAAAKAPFANSVDQRHQMIEELKAIGGLLKEQNALLREQNRLLQSGKLKVLVSQPKS